MTVPISSQKHFSIRIYAGGALCAPPPRGMIGQKYPGGDNVKNKFLNFSKLQPLVSYKLGSYKKKKKIRVITN